jgi:hypothetical protein
MDFDPLTGELYAIAQDQSSCCPMEGDLLILDLDTGAGTIVARTFAFTDMGFHPDGRLFGNGRPDEFDDAIFRINVETGAVTEVIDWGHPHRPGITFDSLGNGVVKERNSIYAFDPDIPFVVFLNSISGSSLLNTLEFDENDVLYGVTDSNLVTIDAIAGTQTAVGPVTNRYTALAFEDEQCFVIDARDDGYSVINDGTTTDLNVLVNDRCKSDRPVSVVVLAGDLIPDQGGLATTDGSAVSYTPDASFTGLEEFTYTAQDAGLDGGDDPPTVDQDTAVVSVTVLEDLAPEAVDDAAETEQCRSIFIDVLENDALGNEPGLVEIETTPANGSATVESDDSIRYFPNCDFFGEDTFEYRLTDANGDSDAATVTVGVFFESGDIPIDIMPGKDGNDLNLRSGGARVEIAILSVGEFFDAPSLIDPLTLKFGPREANIVSSPRSSDVDHDGDADLVIKFLIQQTGIACGATQARLTGRTFGSRFVSGSDAVNTFNCRRSNTRCGLGFELALALMPLLWLRRRRNMV